MKVMVALDGSETSFAALRRALEITKPDDSLLLVHTIEDIHAARFMNVSAVMDMMEARGKNVLKRAMIMCKAQGRSKDTLTEKIVYTKDTREGLLHQMEKQEVDLVCMGSRGLSGVGKALLGSTSAYLLQNAPANCSILVIKDAAQAS